MSRFNKALNNICKVGVLTSDYNYEEHYADYIDHVSCYYQFFKDSRLIAEYNEDYIVKIHYYYEGDLAE